MVLSPVICSQSRAKHCHKNGASQIESYARTGKSLKIHVEVRRPKMWQSFNNVESTWVFATCVAHAANASMMWIRKIGFIWSNRRWRRVIQLILPSFCLLLEAFTLQGFGLLLFLLSVFCNGCTLAAHRLVCGPEGDCTHSNTRWPSPKWPLPTAGPGRRLHTAGSPLLLCCVGTHTPVFRPRSQNTGSHGRCTCIWQMQRRVNKMSL